jgi:hypothetical protein
MNIVSTRSKNDIDEREVGCVESSGNNEASTTVSSVSVLSVIAESAIGVSDKRLLVPSIMTFDETEEASPDNRSIIGGFYSKSKQIFNLITEHFV